jgi:hypothetical protein
MYYTSMNISRLLLLAINLHKNLALFSGEVDIIRRIFAFWIDKVKLTLPRELSAKSWRRMG